MCMFKFMLCLVFWCLGCVCCVYVLVVVDVLVLAWFGSVCLLWRVVCGLLCCYGLCCCVLCCFVLVCCCCVLFCCDVCCVVLLG